jgi:hypothetical protein
MRAGPAIRGLTLALATAGCSNLDDGGAAAAAGSTDSGADTTDHATTSGEATDGVDDSGADAPIVTAEVTLHGGQPMVVDVELTTAAISSVSVVHDADPGVVVARTDDGRDPSVARFRVRGLLPATTHILRYEVVAEQGGQPVVGEVAVQTLPPLPGFVHAFDVDGDRSAADDSYRMFDLTPFPLAEHNGVFMVDLEGTTRFYLCDVNDTVGPAMVWASVELLDDGSLAYLQGNELRIVDELGEVLLDLSDEEIGLTGLHHEIVPLDNGNFLALSYTFRWIDYPVEGPLYVAGDLVVEITPDGDVVWTWDSFDHLDPNHRPHGFFELGQITDPTTGKSGHDWTHGNGIEYTAADDTLLLSLRHQDWIVAIDRATRDVVWRLGPEGDFALVGGDRWFYHPHSPQWQPDGSLLLYDNGVGNPDIADDVEYARAVRYVLDESKMTATQVWTDDAEPFLSPVAGDADRLPGGHLQILDSTVVAAPGDFGSMYSRIRELDPTASPMAVWTLTPPGQHMAYRATAHDRLAGQPRG